MLAKGNESRVVEWTVWGMEQISFLLLARECRDSSYADIAGMELAINKSSGPWYILSKALLSTVPAK